MEVQTFTSHVMAISAKIFLFPPVSFSHHISLLALPLIMLDGLGTASSLLHGPR